MGSVNWRPPEGWTEILSGPSLEVDLAQAVLEASGLHPEVIRLGTAGVFAGSVFEDCRLFTPTPEAEQARRVLEERI